MSRFSSAHPSNLINASKIVLKSAAGGQEYSRSTKSRMALRYSIALEHELKTVYACTSLVSKSLIVLWKRRCRGTPVCATHVRRWRKCFQLASDCRPVVAISGCLVDSIAQSYSFCLHIGVCPLHTTRCLRVKFAKVLGLGIAEAQWESGVCWGVSPSIRRSFLPSARS